MAITQFHVQRFSITSSKSSGDVVKAIDAAISHPDVRVFLKNVESAKSFAEIETLVQNAIGPSDFMEFIRFDLGEVLRKDHAEAGAAESASGHRQSADHEANGRARTGCRFLCAGYDFDR